MCNNDIKGSSGQYGKHQQMEIFSRVENYKKQLNGHASIKNQGQK